MPLVDFTVIFLYLTLTVGFGVACKGSQKSAEDYFTTSGKMGGIWSSILVGMSIAATLFSGISLIGTPSVAYRYGLISLTVPICLFILLGLVNYWFLPRYLTIKEAHPYGFIETRLGSSVRLTAALFFILLRVGWMAALIYVPTLVILAAAGLGPEWFWPVALIIGLTCTLYTAVGGIRSVIVADALQFFVIATGMLVMIGYVLMKLDAGWGQIADEMREENLFQFFDLSLDFKTTLTTWSLLFGITIANLSAYTADQMSLQRYLATGNIRSARRSFSINICMAAIVIVLLNLLGIALFVWYRFRPDPSLPEATDQILPFFISTQLPVGLSGLIIAAIMAATMSSMTSGINSLAGSISGDIRTRFGKKQSPEQALRFARITSIIIGVTATLSAGLVGALGSVFDIAMILLGVFLGPLLAPVVFALHNIRLSQLAVISGMILGFAVGGSIALSDYSSLWVAPSAFVCSLLFPLLLGITGGQFMKTNGV